MISPMLKFRLAGLKREKDAVFDVLFKSGCVDLKDLGASNSVKEQSPMLSSYENLNSRLQNAINMIEDNILLFEKGYKGVKRCIKLQDFTLESSDSTINVILDELDEIKSDQEKLKLNKGSFQTAMSSLEAYLSLKYPLSSYKSTTNVTILLGTLPDYSKAKFDEYISSLKLTDCQSLPSSNAIVVYSHKIESKEVVKRLTELGFMKFVPDFDCTSQERREELVKKLSNLEDEELAIKQKLYKYKDILPFLKLAFDYNTVRIGKLHAEREVIFTDKAFYLEAFVPKKYKEKLEKMLSSSSVSVEFDFINVAKTDEVPTLVESKRLVKPFEFVTNMYSAPNYRDLDPNLFIMFFFSLFLGFVMADIGYGILMIVIGLLIARKQDLSSGTRDLMKVIATSGAFAILFGVMFGSLFGIGHEVFLLVPPAILPNPTKSVLPLLCICLAGGMVQIMVSLALKATLLMRRGESMQALFGAIIWEFFFVGVFMVGLDYLNVIKGILDIGLILAITSISLSAVGQFFINKGINRLTKSFSSIYSVINIFSDVLSYARIFGLMLSGYIISSIVTSLASPMFSSLLGSIFAVIIMIIGHAFNLAMGLLSGYIHVSRLQYVEFFSRFYEGDGKLFSPFLRDLKYHEIAD